MAETRILEINLISAQNLKIPNSTKMRHRNIHTYTIAYVDPRAKLRSSLDTVGGENPTWNEKFIFRVSPHFIYGDTSAVQFEIYACGYIRDYLVGNVRYLLSSSTLTSSKTGAVVGMPAFSAVHIRRPSGRVHGVLNIAATVYESSDFAAFSGMSAVCFRDLIGDNETDDGAKSRRRERRMSWHLSREGSKRSEMSSSGAESSDFREFSDGNESTTSSTSSAATTAAALRELNNGSGRFSGNLAGKTEVKKSGNLAGKKDSKSDGGGLLCGLMLQRRFSFCPSDQNLLALAGFHGRKI